MDNKAKILDIVKRRGVVTAPALVDELDLSRQKITKHLHSLVTEGLLFKEGSTRNAKYSYSRTRKRTPPHKIKMLKEIKNLKEDEVYSEVELRLGLKKLAPNVQTIIFYAFSEMLNNAIDHSKSKKVAIDVGLDPENFKFNIRDSGIGVFANVKRTFHLRDEFEGLEHVLKGKQTTFPERHSGQGIFFTSRIGDIFKIKSHKIKITKDNLADDLYVEETKNIRGTDVYFQIKTHSRKAVRDLFQEYSNDEYEFDKTRIKIKLTSDRELIARSQAKRIMMGLEKYKTIVLDFKDVRVVGQAFVDEVFRVYKNRYPEVLIEYVNANEAVRYMIQRQKD